MNTYGIDWNGPLAVSRNDDDYEVTVPCIQSIAPLPDGVLHDLQDTVHPLDHSCNHRIDLYMTALQFISSRLQVNVKMCNLLLVDCGERKCMCMNETFLFTVLFPA